MLLLLCQVGLWHELRLKLEQAQAQAGSEAAGVWKTYWSAHQRFFKLLCIDLKMETVLAEVGFGGGGVWFWRLGFWGLGGYKKADWLLLCIDLKMETVLAEVCGGMAGGEVC